MINKILVQSSPSGCGGILLNTAPKQCLLCLPWRLKRKRTLKDNPNWGEVQKLFQCQTQCFCTITICKIWWQSFETCNPEILQHNHRIPDFWYLFPLIQRGIQWGRPSQTWQCFWPYLQRAIIPDLCPVPRHKKFSAHLCLCHFKKLLFENQSLASENPRKMKNLF